MDVIGQRDVNENALRDVSRIIAEGIKSQIIPGIALGLIEDRRSEYPSAFRENAGTHRRAPAGLHDRSYRYANHSKPNRSFRIDRSGLIDISPDYYRTTGLNGRRVQRALNKRKADKLPGDLYRFMDTDDPDLKPVPDSFDKDIPLKLYRRLELKNIKTRIKVFE